MLGKHTEFGERFDVLEKQAAAVNKGLADTPDCLASPSKAEGRLAVKKQHNYLQQFGMTEIKTVMPFRFCVPCTRVGGVFPEQLWIVELSSLKVDIRGGHAQEGEG